MFVMHRHQATLAHDRATPGLFEPDGTQQHSPSEIEALPVLEQRGTLLVEPLLVAATNLHRQPIGDIDEVLLFDAAARDLRTLSVVTAGQVRPWIMHSISDGTRRRGSRLEVAVAECA